MLDAREAGVLDLAVATDSEDFDELERRWDADHPLRGETIVAVDVVSGRERWRRRVAGSVRSIVGGPGTAWAVCAPPPHAADRHATLEKLSADGSDSVGAPTLDDPVVVDADDETVLLATARELVAIAGADPRTDFWRVDISGRCQDQRTRH